MRRTSHSAIRLVALLTAVAITVTACSGGDADPEAAPGTDLGSNTESDSSAEADESGDASSDGSVSTNNSGDSGDSQNSQDPAAPARRVPAQESDETSHWVGHGIMTEDAIEVAWSEVEGNDVTYQIFRFDSIGLDPETVPLDTPIHEGMGALGWTDGTVEAGAFYTYVMQVIADGEVLQRRWTDTLAVTDDTPPTDITGLTATVSDGEVLLAWDESADDVEFASYGVFRTDLAEEAQYVGGGADLGVTSFIDNDIPTSGEIGYEVVAVDFHGNRSTPTSITVQVR